MSDWKDFEPDNISSGSFNLSFDLFTRTSEDTEKKQYQILGSLHSVKNEFRQNRIYPYLGQLVELQRNLQALITQLQSMRNQMPKKIRRIDIDKKEIQYEPLLSEMADLSVVEDLIVWALPKIREAIEEGITIYEFVDQNMEVEEVGIHPEYVSEGYVFIPDNISMQLHLFRYEMSVYTGKDEKFRAIKTKLIRSVDKSKAEIVPGSVKLDLIREYQDLPNPATFSFHTSLDLPFRETLFPVARRKLMRCLV